MTMKLDTAVYKFLGGLQLKTSKKKSRIDHREMGESSSENKDDGSSSKHEEENEEMIRTEPGSLGMVLKDSDWKDVLLMVMGSIGSVADGSAMALIMLCLGSLMNGYASSALTPHDINKYAMSLLYVAVGVGSGAFLVTLLFVCFYV
ncbi:hypothetical protein Ddye_021414 [Dipteronia dyeriana]|uniref:Uncharacterized protein n=1 Tax=Dipteronia dyeriana TaxID=168575 RepID=A0AAD9U2P3_9ROSI|nr:hypothetical protein Ddye_021414 [Dipteronia dyeriana]